MCQGCPSRCLFWMSLLSLMCNGCPSCCSSWRLHHDRSCAKDALQDAVLDATRIAHVHWMPFMLFFMMPPSSPLMCQGCLSRCPSGCHSHRSCAVGASPPLMCKGCPPRCPSGCRSHRSCAMDALNAVLHDAPITTAHVPRMPFKMPFWMPLAWLVCNGSPSDCSS